MGFFDATASLQSLTISGNLATVSGSDLAILGNSTRDSTGFVDCASGALGLFPNLFCDGLEGIFDGSSNNTNCAANGKTSGTRCDLA